MNGYNNKGTYNLISVKTNKVVKCNGVEMKFRTLHEAKKYMLKINNDGLRDDVKLEVDKTKHKLSTEKIKETIIRLKETK